MIKLLTYVKAAASAGKGTGAIVTKNTHIKAGETWYGIPAKRLIKT